MNPEIEKVLLQQIRSGDQLQIWEAAKSLATGEAPSSAVPILLEVMRSSAEIERRVAATWVLGSVRSVAAVDPLIQILADKSQPGALRDQAAESLGYISDPRAREVVIKGLGDPNANVLFSCVFAMRTLGRLDDIPQLERLALSSSATNSYGASVAQEAREAIEQIRNRGEHLRNSV